MNLQYKVQIINKKRHKISDAEKTVKDTFFLKNNNFVNRQNIFQPDLNDWKYRFEGIKK